MNNTSLQGIYNAYCSNIMQGVQAVLPQQNNSQNSQNSIQGPLCQYYNNASQKKYPKSSQAIQSPQCIVSEQKRNFRDAQNLKLQKHLSQQAQVQQYPYLQQQTNSLQMLILKDLYSNFFQDIMREYKFYSQAITDIDLQYPIQNRQKRTSNNSKEWFEQNYINILRSQYIKNNQIKQTITQFRNTNIPKKALKVIQNQKSFSKNRMLNEIGQEEIHDTNDLKKQFQITPQGLISSVSPISKVKNEVKFKISSRNQVTCSSNSVTRTESNWRKEEQNNNNNSQIFQKRVPLKDKRDNQYLAEIETKRYHSVTKRYITYDSNMSNTIYNNFKNNQNGQKIDCKTEKDQQLYEEEFSYMAGGVKIRVNTFSENVRSERSQSLIKELPNKLSDINLNRINFSGQKNNNIQMVNKRKILTDQLFSISPKHNYQVCIEDKNQLKQKYKTELNINKDQQDKSEDFEQQSQILNILRDQKQIFKNHLNIQQASSVLIVNKNPPQMNSSVLKQQNMQLLKIENLHTSPTSRSKQQSFSNCTSNNSYLDQNQAKYKLQINPNCNYLPSMRAPSSNRIQGGGSQTKRVEQGQLVMIPQYQHQNQLQFQNQPISPLVYQNLNEYLCQTPSLKQKDSSNNQQKINKYEGKGNFNILQLTPIQSKSNSNLDNNEELSKSKNKKREKNTLKELICSYYETPKNVFGNATPIQLQYSPLYNNRSDALKKQINLDLELKNNQSQLTQDQSNRQCNEQQFKLAENDISNETNIKKISQKVDMANLKQEKKFSDTSIIQNFPNLLEKKDSFLPNNTFNIQQSNQDEENKNDFQQIQNTIWFQNSEILGQFQDYQNKNSIEQCQVEQKKNDLSVNFDEHFDDNYKININKSFQRKDKSQDKNQRVNCKNKQITSSEYLDKSSTNKEVYPQNISEKVLSQQNNLVLLEKQQSNMRQSPSSSFRQYNSSRQRIYQNQRQILNEIQKANPIINNIQTQQNQKSSKDKKVLQAISDDKVSESRKVSLISKEKSERQDDSINSLKASSSERNEERQVLKNQNPYLQKNDFLKKIKKKQDKNQVLCSIIDLKEYSNFEGSSQLNTFKENSSYQNSIEATKRQQRQQQENIQKESILNDKKN